MSTDGWQYQGVLNVGVQIVLLVFMGWGFARWGLLEGERFMGQINVLILRAAFPALTIYLLGIKLDLRDAEAWRSLGAYVLWVAAVQLLIILWTWLFNGRNTGDAGLLNLVLTANNTVIVGLPVMEATFPDVGGRLSLLSAFVLFLQVIPFSITAFEVERWMVDDHEKQRLAAAAAALPQEPGTPDRKLSADLAHYDNQHIHPSNGGSNGHGGAVKVAEQAAEPSNGLGVVAVDEWTTHGSRWADGSEGAAAARTADGAVDAAAVVVPEYGAVGRGWAPGTPRSMMGAGSLCSLGSGSPGSSPEGSLARGSANGVLLTEAPGSIEGAPGRGGDGGGGGGGGDFVVQVTFARGEAATAAAAAAASDCRLPSMSEAGGGAEVPLAMAASGQLRAFPQRSTTGGAFMGGSGKGLRVAVGRGSTGGPAVRADGSVTFATSMPGGGGPGDVGRRGSTPHLVSGSRGRRMSGQQLGSRSHSGSTFGGVSGSGSAGSSGRSGRAAGGGRTGPGPVAEAVEEDEEQGAAAVAKPEPQREGGEATSATVAGAGAERRHSLEVTSPTPVTMGASVAAPALAPAAARQPRHVSLSGRYMPQQRPTARTVGGGPPPLPLPPSFPFPPPPPTAPASPPLPPARPNATLPPALDKVIRALPAAPSTAEPAKTADAAAAELLAGPASAKPTPDNASEAPLPAKPQAACGPPAPSRAASAGGATPELPTPFQPPSRQGLGQPAGSIHEPNSQQLTNWLAFSRPSLDLPRADAYPAGAPFSLVSVGSGALVSGRMVSSPGASPLPVLHRAASIAGCPMGHHAPPHASAVRWPHASMGGGVSARSLTLHREGPLLPSVRSLNLSGDVRVAPWAEGGAAEAAGWAAGGGGSGRLLPAHDSTTSSLLLSPRRSSLPAAAAVAAIAGRPDAFMALKGGGGRGATDGGRARGREVSWSKAVLRLGPGSRVSSARVRAQQKRHQHAAAGEEEFEFHKGSSKESWDGSGGSLNSFGSARSGGAGGSKGTGSFSMHRGEGRRLQQEQGAGGEQGQGSRKNEAGVAGLLAELLGGWLPAAANSTAPASDEGGTARGRNSRTVGCGPRSADAALPGPASATNTAVAATAVPVQSGPKGAGGNGDADFQAWRNGSSGGVVCGGAPSFTQGVLPVSPASTASSAPPANPAPASECPALQPSVSSPKPQQQQLQGPRGAAGLEGLEFQGPTSGTPSLPPSPLGATPVAAAPATGPASVAHWPNVPVLGSALPPRTSGAGTGVQPPPKGPVQGALYGRLSGAGGAAGAVLGAPVVIPLGAPRSPPRASRRLLNPTVVACGDLPVPQALDLARSSRASYAGNRLSVDGRLSVAGGDADLRTPPPSPPLSHLHPGARAAAAADGLHAAAAHYPTTRASADLTTRMQLIPEPAARPTSHESIAAATAAAIGDGATAAVGDGAPAVQVLLAAEDEPPGRRLVRAKAGSMMRRHGGLAAAMGRWLKLQLQEHRRAWLITWVVIKNPLLWSLLVALLVNLSGLRSVLWAGSAHYRPELGWVAGSLAWVSGITVPVSLFSNGVWLHGKSFGRPTLLRALGLLALKLLVLGPLQLACAAVCRLSAEAAMSLLLLALCPVASTSFVIASQYGHGADIVTAVTIGGIVLLVPAVLIGLALPKAMGLYDYVLGVG